MVPTHEDLKENDKLFHKLQCLAQFLMEKGVISKDEFAEYEKNYERKTYNLTGKIAVTRYGKS